MAASTVTLNFDQPCSIQFTIVLRVLSSDYGGLEGTQEFGPGGISQTHVAIITTGSAGTNDWLEIEDDLGAFRGPDGITLGSQTVQLTTP